jgi:MtN3 and saliva related transmembrane protein
LEWIGTAVGLGAAICTTASYVPQVKKSWSTGETGDISLKMLVLLAMGLGLWITYGVISADVVIVLANGASLALLSVILYCKLTGESRGVLEPDQRASARSSVHRAELRKTGANAEGSID